MSDTRSLGRAALAVAVASAIAVACGSDLVDLLPPMSRAGSAGAAGTGAISSAGTTSSGGMRNDAGSSPTSQGGISGALTTGGNGGTFNGGCSGFGFGCGDGGENPGFGGSFGGSFGGPFCPAFGSCTRCVSDAQCLAPEPHCSRFLGNICVECAENGSGQCKPGQSCDRNVGRCGQSCKSSADCLDNRFCDLMEGTCVACFDNRQCESNPAGHLCYLRRCVQCLDDADCTLGDRRHCANLECVQCTSDKDCTGTNGGAGHCDTAHARCL